MKYIIISAIVGLLFGMAIGWVVNNIETKSSQCDQTKLLQCQAEKENLNKALIECQF